MKLPTLENPARDFWGGFAALLRDEEVALELHEVELFAGRKARTLAALEQCMETRSVAKGETIFLRGDSGDELFPIRRGAMRLVLPLSAGQTHHLGTFGRGAFFGEMAFLDGVVRSADAVACVDTELYVLLRRAFEVFAFSVASAHACSLYEPGHAESRTADLRFGRLPARQTRHLFLWTWATCCFAAGIPLAPGVAR